MGGSRGTDRAEPTAGLSVSYVRQEKIPVHCTSKIPGTVLPVPGE